MPKLLDVITAHERIAPFVAKTSVHQLWLTRRSSSYLWIKNENEQPSGAFKLRGATNAALFSSNAETLETISSGNHGAAVAYIARELKKRSVVWMPADSPLSKQQKIQSFGGEVKLVQAEGDWHRGLVQTIRKDSKIYFIHPYDDPQVIAGQGTVALEAMAQIPRLTSIYVPVSGGGLLSGVALAAKSINPRIKIYGVEPINIGKVKSSFLSGSAVSTVKRNTIADALRAPNLGKIGFSLIQNYVDDIIQIKEEEIIEAMRFLHRPMPHPRYPYLQYKMLVEPSGAIATAAVLFGKLSPGKSPLAIVSGEGISFEKHRELLTR